MKLVTTIHFKPSPGRQPTHTAPGSLSVDEEVSVDVFVPTPIATVSFLDKEVLKEKKQQFNKKTKVALFLGF